MEFEWHLNTNPVLDMPNYLNFNNARVEKAKDENEVWKIAKDITNPKYVG